MQSKIHHCPNIYGPRGSKSPYRWWFGWDGGWFWRATYHAAQQWRWVSIPPRSAFLGAARWEDRWAREGNLPEMSHYDRERIFPKIDIFLTFLTSVLHCTTSAPVAAEFKESKRFFPKNLFFFTFLTSVLHCKTSAPVAAEFKESFWEQECSVLLVMMCTWWALDMTQLIERSAIPRLARWKHGWVT